jgi:hypothetical protein
MEDYMGMGINWEWITDPLGTLTNTVLKQVTSVTLDAASAACYLGSDYAVKSGFTLATKIGSSIACIPDLAVDVMRPLKDNQYVRELCNISAENLQPIVEKVKNSSYYKAAAERLETISGQASENNYWYHKITNTGGFIWKNTAGKLNDMATISLYPINKNDIKTIENSVQEIEKFKFTASDFSASELIGPSLLTWVSTAYAVEQTTEALSKIKMLATMLLTLQWRRSKVLHQPVLDHDGKNTKKDVIIYSSEFFTPAGLVLDILRHTICAWGSGCVTYLTSKAINARLDAIAADVTKYKKLCNDSDLCENYAATDVQNLNIDTLKMQAGTLLTALVVAPYIISWLSKSYISLTNKKIQTQAEKEELLRNDTYRSLLLEIKNNQNLQNILNSNSVDRTE